ncbi:MAG: hypothetical protein IT453_16840 [Planctomycetes bacterium]|nr:hypothetical protein [Planctomycetota bacterium]
MNWSLESLHRKSAVFMVILTVFMFAISFTQTVLGSRGWQLVAPWAMTALITASTLDLVRRVRRAQHGTSQKLVQDEGE